MIFSVRSPDFLPFATILPPDPTGPLAAHGESTVAPLREIHAQSALHMLYYEITLSMVSHSGI